MSDTPTETERDSGLGFGAHFASQNDQATTRDYRKGLNERLKDREHAVQYLMVTHADEDSFRLALDDVICAAQLELLEALRIYADAANWKCPRCGKSDSLNCYMGRWCGPNATTGREMPEGGFPGEGHGYDVAREALGQ